MPRFHLLYVLMLASLPLGPSNAPAQTFTPILTGDVVTDARYSEGTLWEDVDVDGDLDLVVTNIVGQDNLLYRNDGAGVFALDGAGPVVTDGGFSYGGCFADFDNDGDPDLFVINGGSSQTVANFYYRNDPTGFAKQGSGPLATDPGGSWSSASADYDLDGDLDVFVANFNQNNALYRNDGGGAFAKIATGPVVTDGGSSLGSSWADYDNDGDPDLFVANANFGAGETNFLYRNDGAGAFVRILTGQIATDVKNSVGGSWADFDNDDDLDLLVTNYSNTNNQFYRNDGAGNLTRVTMAVGVNHQGSSVGATFGDYDNDGFVDLFVSNDNHQDNLLYRNTGGGTFSRLLTGAPVTDGGRSNGTSWADIDRDGDLDLFVTNGDQPVTQNNFLYRNDGLAGANRWLNVRCVGVVSNRSAIGTRVRVLATIDGSPRWQMREIVGQTGYNTQPPLEAAFGLGDAALVDSLLIDWPLGQHDVYTNVPVDRFLRLVESVDPTGSPGSEAPPVAGFSLAQNRPNPFRDHTTVSWASPVAGPASLELFDVRGRRVRTLARGSYEAGQHTVQLQGDGLPSGTYFYVLRTPLGELSRRLERLR